MYCIVTFAVIGLVVAFLSVRTGLNEEVAAKPELAGGCASKTPVNPPDLGQEGTEFAQNRKRLAHERS